MKCSKCKTNQIKYKDNCFDIANSLSKYHFYDPEHNNCFSSCKQKYRLYIKEDTNECIPLTDEGYFISDLNSGLLRKCHENCLSCIIGPTKTKSGYIISMERLKCKDSNSQQKTMIKMDNNCFKIVDYNESTIIFNASEIKSGSQFATCSDFGKILNYSEYECINDSSVIELTEINESTIIIKNSNEICSNNFDEWNRNKANGTENENIQIEVMESNTNFIINNTYMNETKFIDELVEIQKSITY